MEIRWLLLAKGSRLNATGSLDVAEIFENYRTDGPPYILDFVVLIKIAPDLTLAGETAYPLLRIFGGQTDYQTIVEYRYPTLNELLEGATPFLRVPITMELLAPGEYTVAIMEGQNLLAGENLKLVDSKEVSDAGFTGQERQE